MNINANKDLHSDLLQKIATDQCSISFQELFSIYATKIYKFALSKNMNDSAARDLAQEVMTVVWTKAHMFSPEKGNASTWIFTIARNMRYDLLRKNVREGKVISSSSLWEIENMSGSPQLIDQDANLEEVLANKEIAGLVNELPEIQRQVIQEVYYNGLTQDEYAKKIGIPIGTVKSRIRLAIRKLNHLLRHV